jgi:hypothetical protein
MTWTRTPWRRLLGPCWSCWMGRHIARRLKRWIKVLSCLVNHRESLHIIHRRKFILRTHVMCVACVWTSSSWCFWFAHVCNRLVWASIASISLSQKKDSHIAREILCFL